VTTTWHQLALDSSLAAKDLLGSGRYRSGVSRAYYAAYAATTARLMSQGLSDFGRFANPSHAELPVLVQHSMQGLSVAQRRKLAKAIRTLRLMREDADYRPGTGLAKPAAVESLRLMSDALRTLQERRRA
jgi:uncharacterized protein (UPF0332 family)